MALNHLQDVFSCFLGRKTQSFKNFSEYHVSKIAYSLSLAEWHHAVCGCEAVTVVDEGAAADDVVGASADDGALEANNSIILFVFIHIYINMFLKSDAVFLLIFRC